MSWSIGFDKDWNRDIGYGVPAWCDYPGCYEEIDRGLSYVCGGEPYGEPHGCGLYFCAAHHSWEHQTCDRCHKGKKPFKPSLDHPDWIEFKATDESWAEWRAEHPEHPEFALGREDSVTGPNAASGDERSTPLYRSKRDMKRAFRDGKGVYEDGQSSFSVNCQEARARGRRPMTQAVIVVRELLAAEGIHVTVVEARKALILTHDGEWHHTSKFGNRTHYYDPGRAMEKLRRKV